MSEGLMITTPHVRGIDEFDCIRKEEVMAYSQIVFQYLAGRISGKLQLAS
jgi:hypothetical protein